MTIVEFLTARFDEDEALARKASEHASATWHLDDLDETVLWWPPEPKVAEWERTHMERVTADKWQGQTIESLGDEIAPHIARHDPAHTLADIAAKRAVIADYASRDGDTDLMLGPDCQRQREWSGLRVAVRHLASAYADHPDYQQEWSAV